MLPQQSKPCFKSCRHLTASGLLPGAETAPFHKSVVTWKATENITDFFCRIFSGIKYWFYAMCFDVSLTLYLFIIFWAWLILFSFRMVLVLFFGFNWCFWDYLGDDSAYAVCILSRKQIFNSNIFTILGFDRDVWSLWDTVAMSELKFWLSHTKTPGTDPREGLSEQVFILALQNCLVRMH